MKKMPVKPEQNAQQRVILGAFLGISVVATIQLITVQSMDLPLTASVYSFAVSIPLLTLGLFAAIIESREQYMVESQVLLYADAVGVVATGAGIVAMFFHFSFPAIWVLGILIILAVIFSSRFQDRLTEVNKSDEKKQ